MKTLKLLILLFSVLITTTACKPDLIKSANTLSNAAELKLSLADANELLEVSQSAYLQKKDQFDTTEQRLMNRGFQQITVARNQLNALFHAPSIDSVVAYGSFMRTYSDAREGYRLIRGVLNDRELSHTHKALLEQSHEKVIQIDYLVDQLTPKSDQFDYEAVIRIISASATLVKAVQPLVNNDGS